MSKAFFRERNITPFKKLLSIFQSHSLLTSSKAVSVENIGRNRDGNKLLLFRYSVSCLKTILLINLLTTVITEIGLYLFGSDFRPSPKIGVTLAILKLFGNIPLQIERKVSYVSKTTFRDGCSLF